ncbi:MAG: hypothetical protein QOH06_3540 [Acidobacteriota bacterium]|jgi:hypothetical protein|nr:hypothetical protein [Acidobacteriota bacterium]
MVEAEIPRGPLWHIVAAFAAVLPAAGAALAVRGVMNVFQGMALTGSGGVGAVAAGLYEANRPLIAAAAVAAILAGWLTVAVLRKPWAFPGLPLSFAPVLACVPALLLWMVESFTLAVIDPHATGSAASIGEESQRLSNLVIASFGSAITVLLIVIAIFAVSLARPRSTDSSLPPAAVWAAMTVLLLGLAVAFYMRSSYLHQVGMTGQL